MFWIIYWETSSFLTPEMGGVSLKFKPRQAAAETYKVLQ